MGGNLNTGLVLLVLGLSVVFLVLLFLMFVMQIMSKIINTNVKTKTKLVGENANEEELAVIMAIMNEVNPGHGMANIRLKLIQ